MSLKPAEENSEILTRRIGIQTSVYIRRLTNTDPLSALQRSLSVHAVFNYVCYLKWQKYILTM